MHQLCHEVLHEYTFLIAVSLVISPGYKGNLPNFDHPEGDIKY